MATINITGTLTGPIDGYVLSNSSIKFIATENYAPIAKGSSSVYQVDAQGLYNFDVYYGTYVIYVLDGVSWRLLGRVVVTDQLPSTLSLVGMLDEVTPLTPSEILYVEQLTSSVESAASQVAADLIQTNLDTQNTAADLLLTNADVISTGLDLDATNADAVQTGLDRDATNQDTIDTASDVVLTGLDLDATNADVISTSQIQSELEVVLIPMATSIIDTQALLIQYHPMG